MNDLLKRLENLSPEKRELVLKKLRVQQAATDHESQTPTIMPVSREQPIPLSFAQSRLWFLYQQMADRSAAYNTPLFLQLTGSLNITALEQAIATIVQRHEVLRTTFSVVNENPVQVIAPTLTLRLPITELQTLPEEERFAEALQLANEALQRPFDLVNGPLLRVTLLRLSNDDHVLLLVMHHIITDGWSMGVLTHELSVLYEAFCVGKPSPLPALPIQYADFAHWQRQWLTGEVLETQLNYWLQHMHGAPPLLELPADRPRPSVQSHQGRSEFLTVNPDLTQKLKHLSQASGTTLFMILLAAFTVLLSRYSRQEDIVAGSPVANRNRRETESLIGCFVNMLVLRTNLQGNPRFLELLKRVRQVTLDAYTHQDLPFEKLVDELQVERSLTHNPLFQTGFALQNAPRDELALPGLTIKPFKWKNTTTLFDLALFINETEQGLRAEWEYNSDLFEAETIQRMAGHFEVLLNAIVENPAQTINTLPLMTAREIQQLQTWNQTDSNYPKDQTVVALFEQQVAKTPENIAIVFEEQSLTYRQLNQKANQLAHHLIQAHNIQPDTLIGICVERSTEMIIGLLGILKAGGAYVPLAPDYPKERLQFMLEDSQASLLLSQTHLQNRLPLHQSKTLYLNDWQAFEQQSVDNPVKQSAPDNLAYVIYTSGSTGQPKGVMVEHRNVVAMLHGFEQMTPATGKLAGSSVCPFSFDVFVWECFSTFGFGHCLHLLPSELVTAPDELAAYLTQNQIAQAYLPPGILEAVVEYFEQHSVMPLQRLLVGVEPIPEGLLQRFRDLSKTLAIINGYGPTETTVCATFYHFHSARSPSHRTPIGRAVANYRVCLCDAQLQPAAVGIPGEILISGMGVSRGYLNQPELTAEKFVEIDWFGQREQIYKTGDLARWLPDGNLEFLGRIDHQVKLRGFRIELGEIEAVLSQYEAVNEAVVILYEGDGHKRLVAYVSGNSKSNWSVELKTWLKSRLPDYMIPTQIVVLDALPLTPNGKVDRKALPAPDLLISSELELPATPTEEMLAALWTTLLKRETIGRGDNFFEQGGHSLSATQLIARIRDQFGVELPVHVIFEQAVLSELALAIDKAASGIALPPIEAQPEAVPKVLSFAQQRLWFLGQLEGASRTYNMPIALQFSGKLDVEALRASLAYLLERHTSLRMCFPKANGQPQIALLNSDDIEVLSVQDLRDLESETQVQTMQHLSDEHARTPFDLSTGPLFKAKLLQLSELQNVLLINMHHIIGDGWSMGVFKREWRQAYMAFAQGQMPELAPLSIQYTDYAAWQQSWLQGEVLEVQLNYWKKQLNGAPELLELPGDYPRPAQQSYQGARYEYCMTPELTSAIKTFSQQQKLSSFMTLLATFSILLSRYSGQNDVCIGSAIANRTHSHTENLMGFFVNTLVMRTQIQPDQCVSELLQQTRQSCLDAYAHQDIPFEYLVEQLQPPRSLSHSPLFQVVLVLQNTERAEFKLPGLEIEQLYQDYPYAKFDIVFDLSEYNNRLYCSWEYATDLFELNTIQRMAKHFEVLLNAIIEHPEQTVYALPLLTPEEKQQLQAWNQTDSDYPAEQTLVDLFEQQVAKTPDNIAVVFEEQSLTYGQLNQKASQLAHKLINDHAIQPETFVAVCVERSKEMVIGLVGILKAGGAYVPLNPEYPLARLIFLMEDAKAAVLLTQTKFVAQQDFGPIPTICLDSDWENLSQEAMFNHNSPVQAHHSAYLIYTSGSTGKPKGVLIEHRSVVNTLIDINQRFRVNEQDRVLALSALNFDLSVYDLFGLLTAGGAVIIPNADEGKEPDHWINLIKQHDVTVWNSVPALMQMLVDHVSKHSQKIPHSLRLVLMSGDWIPLSLPEQIKALWPQTQVISLGGATEVSIWSIYYPIDKVSPGWKSIPYGKPLANQRFYVLDQALEPCPLLVAGNLYIGGIGLARAYWGDQEKTQASFIIHPHTQERLYKTGDLGRYLLDGNIEFLGRIDHQIKLRGFRVELGEIEATLTKHPGIQEAVVILSGEKATDKRLLAYIVPSADNAADKSRQAAVQVAQWLQIFNDAYRLPHNSNNDPTLNSAGWQDSCTGLPIPQADMQEWRDVTVAQVLELAPKRVLEIGCGSGMLLFKIAPHCEQYQGTDISAEALHYIEQHLAQQSFDDKVSLRQNAANQFDGIEARTYDLVIINSVIQYFPSLDYFMRVLEGTVNAVTNGGVIFIGDVRNLQLLEAFHTAVQFYNAPRTLSLNQLRQRIQNSLYNEEELLLDPELFIALQQRFPRISQVQIQLKAGYAHTEMNRFRYDVFLYLDQGVSPASEPQWLNWQTEQLNQEQIRTVLTTEQPDLLGIQSLPNARLMFETQLLEQLDPTDGLADGTVADLKAVLEQSPKGIEPANFQALAQDLPYSVFIQYANTTHRDYNVVFQRETLTSAAPATRARFITPDVIRPKPWQDYANHPLQHRISQIDPALLAEWRTFLKQNLPEYMIPNHFTMLDALPLTPNGKIDRKALPAPDVNVSAGFEQTITPTEELLAILWSEVLKREFIGRHDNFFELGGHSLLATQLAARIRDRFRVELPVRTVFEQPELSALAVAIDEAASGIVLPPIEAQPDEAAKVLSFAQQRLWFLAQFESASATYNMPMALQLDGVLDVEALRSSLAYLLERHTSLRMSLPEADGLAQVVIHPLDESEVLAIQDLSDQEAQAETVQRLIDEQAQTPFDLNTGPLFKAKLLQLSKQRNVLLINMHHIISDGWSMGILIREWQAAYAAFVQGQEPTLMPLRIQYTDYAAWQRNWLQGEVLDIQIDYWKNKLSGMAELLELPADHPRPAQQSYQGNHYEYNLAPELTQALKTFSQQQGSSLFMTLLAAFSVLLYRYSRQNDFCIGSPIANRTHSHTEELLGFFVNTLVLRSQLQPENSFTELLQQTRQTCMDAYAHQDIPFEHLVEQLQPQRSLSHSPLFQVMFALQNNERVDLNFVGLDIKALEQNYPFAKFDLALSLSENDNQLHGTWEYATDLFEANTIQQMAEHFVILLNAITQNPEQIISLLPLMTSAEIQQLQAWNQTQADYPKKQTVIDQFEQQVEQTPDNIAVVFANQGLTYQQLNDKANQLAYYLIRLKAGLPTCGDWLVAICVERSLEMIIGLLGILKAGGAYIPIDPNYPKERIQFMLEDSAASVLLTTQTALKDRLSFIELEQACQMLCLDGENLNGLPTNNPSLQNTHEDLAYVIYTSGSTGEPKGVMIEHRNLLSSTWARQQYYQNNNMRLLLLPSFAFDGFVAGIFGALSTGSSLYLPQSANDVDHLLALICQHRISHLIGVPALYLALLNQTHSVLNSLKAVILGGEIPNQELLQQHIDKAPLAKVFNEYGPTECCVWSSVYQYRGLADLMNNIGQPIANTSIYILDAQNQPLPPGILGELCIAGANVARGYFNRSELTAEKFVEIQLFGQTERIYKTGDLARWQPDGNLEYLGRLDHQVKLRGFRIELGEIEAVLSQYEPVTEAVVILYEEDGNKRLAAYMTTTDFNPADFSAELKIYLNSRLPDYMVPSQFIVLEVLPLTPNGKIDRNALPAPDGVIAGQYEAPRNELEQQLTDVWSAVLKRDNIGIHHNFFDLGGHSLLAVTLLNHIQQVFQQKLSLGILFQNPSIAQLVKHLHGSEANPSMDNLLSIQPLGKETPLFCIPGANGYAFYFRDIATHLMDRSVYGLETPGRDGQIPLPDSVAVHASQLITTLREQQAHGPYLLAGYSSGCAVAFEMTVQLEQQGETVSLLAIFDSGLVTKPEFLVQRKDIDWIWDHIQRIEALKGVSLGLEYEQLAEQPDDEARWHLAAESFYRHNVLPEHSSLALLKTSLIVGKHLTLNYAAYQPKQPISAPIALFRAKEIHEIVLQEVYQMSDYKQPDWGWQTHTPDPVKVRWVPGNHGQMLYDPNVQILAAELQAQIHGSD